MGGQTVDVSKEKDYKFMDPTGNYQGAMDFSKGMYNDNNAMMQQYAGQAAGFAEQAAGMDPNAYMNQFMGQAEGLSNLVSGANAPLQQSLNSIAQRQARMGSEAALAAMPGAANSGAGMAAFADAYASPFAQAQAQLQQNQLQGTLGLWGQAMDLNQASQAQAGQNYLGAAGLMSGLGGLYGGMAQQGAQQYAQMAEGQGAWKTPQYQYQKGAWDYGKEMVQLGLDAYKALKQP